MSLLIGAVLSLGIGLTHGLFGGGGSMLTLPMLVYVLGVAPRSAIAASLFVICVTSATGALAHARAGRVMWRIGAIFGLAGMMGAYAAGRLARVIPGRVLLFVFALEMLVASLAMMRSRKERAPASRSCAPSVSRSITIGAGVGALAGLVGAGGGFLIVPALELAGGLGVAEAIGTSPVVIAIQSLAGFVSRLGSVDLDWQLVGAISLLGMVGAVGGARAAQRFSPGALRRGLAWLILGVALIILGKQIHADGLDVSWAAGRLV